MLQVLWPLTLAVRLTRLARPCTRGMEQRLMLLWAAVQKCSAHLWVLAQEVVQQHVAHPALPACRHEQEDDFTQAVGHL